MIIASTVFLVVALVTFGVGVTQTGYTMIGASIASSALALLTLIVGVVRGRRKVPVTFAGIPEGSEEMPLEPQMRIAPIEEDRTMEAPPLLEGGIESESAEEDLEETARPVAPRRKPAARKPAARKPAARKPAARAKTTAGAKSTSKSSAKKAAPRKTTARKPATRPRTQRPGSSTPEG